MKEKREKISFWISIVSFVGGIVLVVNAILSSDQRDKEYRECFKKALYYQHRSDSLEQVIKNETQAQTWKPFFGHRWIRSGSRKIRN